MHGWKGAKISNSMPFTFSSFVYCGKSFHFCSSSQEDYIQQTIRAGSFYEVEELELLRSHVPNAKTFLDVGANVGNHSVFFASFFNAEKICIVEPNEDIIPALLQNLSLNFSRAYELSGIGVGLGEAEYKAAISIHDRSNLGGATLTPDDQGQVSIRRGDDLFSKLTFDIIKIDTEGYEIEVMNGLKMILEERKSVIFIEVRNENIEAVQKLAEELGYFQFDTFRRYKSCINLLFRPE